MANVTVMVNDRAFTLACEAGQEERISKLAEYLDGKTKELADQIGKAADTQLLLMAGLVIADELAEKIDELEETQLLLEGAQTSKATDAGAVEESEDRLISVLSAAADRLESMSRRLEAAGADT